MQCSTQSLTWGTLEESTESWQGWEVREAGVEEYIRIHVCPIPRCPKDYNCQVANHNKKVDISIIEY